MSNINKRQEGSRSSVGISAPRNYNEIIEFLDSHWQTRADLTALKKVDAALGFPSKSLNTILVTGTNGKGLTIHFASKLLKEEGLKVGAFYSPHILTYNERLVINNEVIGNKAFVDLANEVLAAAQTSEVSLTSREMLTMMALLHFKNNDVEVVLLEMVDTSTADAVTICNPKIFAITRLTDDESNPKNEITANTIHAMLEVVKAGTHVVSADQSKLNLQVMLDATKARNGIWSMPIRKLAILAYPFEQLHGRCAALAERICQIFIDNLANKDTLTVENSLLAKQKGQRGRPTLEAKRKKTENPKKTLEQFWKDEVSDLPARFQILDKEKPTILLDNARNIDALKNLLLGVRLLHYQRPLKGLIFIFGCDSKQMDVEEFLRLLRYFSKKNSCQVIFCPIEGKIPGMKEESWNVEQITNDVKSLKIKAKSAKNFQEAFEIAKKSVDERNGLVVISGSQSIIYEFWQYKGIKKI